MFTSLNPRAVGARVDFLEGVQLAARYGFDAVSIDVGFLRESGVARVNEALDEHGLIAGSIGLPVSFREDDETYQKSVDRLPEVAAAARAVGCTRCSTYILSWSDDLDFEANFAHHRDRLRRPAEILAEHGIRLGLEFLGPKTLREGHRYEFIHTIEGMLDLCEAIGTGNVGLLLDAWHWYTSGGDQAQLEALTDDHVVDVHVNDAPAGIPVDQQVDNVRHLPGETGVIPISPFLQALERMGYTGPIMVEPFDANLRTLPPEEAVRKTSEALQKVLQAAGVATRTKGR